MTPLRFTTAGESHGPALVVIVEGVPAGLPLLAEHVDAELARRQQGYGRGRRMQIETDRVEFLGGVRAGETLGGPVAMLVRNADWKNWIDVMDPAPRAPAADAPAADAPGGGAGAGAVEGAAGATEAAALRRRAITRVRPGHADLVGVLKYDRQDARDILERASARETTVRVAAGAVCRQLLAAFGVRVGSHVVSLGGVDAHVAELPEDLAVADRSPVRMLDPEAESEVVRRIDAAKRAGDTLGGVCEVVVTGLPVGLGSHVSWDRKLDGRLAQAILSIPAVKGVEIGLGFEAARQPGSAVHDEIERDDARALTGAVRRRSNRAGGLEGGITTGEPLVLRVAMKPISTLMRPLGTVDLRTGGAAAAAAERSDVTAVPAMGVIAEAMTAFVVAQAFLEKFGGDSLGELRRNYEGYVAQVRGRMPRAGAGPAAPGDPDEDTGEVVGPASPPGSAGP